MIPELAFLSKDETLPPKEGDLKFNNRWSVKSVINMGETTHVCTAVEEGNPKLYAMKIEPVTELDMFSKVMIEAYILRKLQGKKHVLQLYDVGMEHLRAFMVTKLAGRNLQQLLSEREAGCFSLATTMRVGVQCLRAIHDLHEIGFTHRKIKPTNFIVEKTAACTSVVLMIDYGQARLHMDVKRWKVRPPRVGCQLQGGATYASPNAHCGLEQGFHDDLWSWLYMLIHFCLGKLPWHSIVDSKHVGVVKRTITDRQLLGSMPKAFYDILEMVKRLNYTDIPDYAKLNGKLLELHAFMDKKDMADKFDWDFEAPVKN